MGQKEKYERFLKFIASKDNPVTYGHILKELKIDRKQFERISKQLGKYFDTIDHVKGKESDWNYHLVQIKHEGIEYLRNLELQELTEKQTEILKISKYTEIAMVVVTILLVLVTLGGMVVTILQYNKFSYLVDKQVESMPPLKPSIVHFNKGDNYFQGSDVAYPLTYFEDDYIKTWSKRTIVIGFLNIGQIPAGYVNIHIGNEYIHSPGGHIPFLGGTLTGNNSELKQFEIWFEGCSQGDTKEKCNHKLVPKGPMEVNISISCQYCDEDIHDAITLCFFENSSKECPVKI